jgi:hypothetical protein
MIDGMAKTEMTNAQTKDKTISISTIGCIRKNIVQK